ncbi:MAG: hypothetical protein NT030_02670, partial [Candidatus Saganbacteria bacterium]|nr:hypothetical protein [Candidatus Saganbacteria bacterium]
MTKITSMGQYHGTKRINNIRSTNKNNAIGAQKKSLQEAIVYHEKRADKYLQLFNESIPKLQIMLNENNPALNPVIRDYSLAIPLTPPFINKNSPDHLLFQDYIDGIWLLSGLEIYTGIMYLKLKVPKNDSLYEESAIRQIHGLNQYALHLKHKLTELKARLDSLPPFCNAKEHNYSIVLSLGPHEIEADEYYFDNLVSEYQPNLVILEHLFNYHSNLLLDPRTLEETSSFYKYEYSPFQSELFRLIKRSKDFNLTFRYIENLPIHEIVEAYSLYLKNEDSPLRLYDIDSDLQLNFSNSSILHRASSMREKNILQNIRELLENFDFYFPRLANNKDISIFMRYGGAHFVLAKELMKLSPENLGVYL